MVGGGFLKIQATFQDYAFEGLFLIYKNHPLILITATLLKISISGDFLLGGLLKLESPKINTKVIF